MRDWPCIRDNSLELSITLLESSMKTMSSLFGVAMAVAVTLPVHAQFAKPEDAVKYRKASFTVMAAHFGRLGAMANGRAPYDAKMAAENADVVLTLS